MINSHKPYKCEYGCKLPMLSKNDKDRHMKEKYLDHFEILLGQLHYYGLIRSFQKKNKETSEFVKSLLDDKFDDLSSTLKEAQELKRKIEVIKASRLEQFKRLEHLETFDNIGFEGKTVWLINTNEWINNVFDSPIFFLTRYGYKMKLRIYKDSKLENKLVLVMLKHVYDPILPKEFETQVRLNYGNAQSRDEERKSKDKKVKLENLSKTKEIKIEIPLANFEGLIDYVKCFINRLHFEPLTFD